MTAQIIQFPFVSPPRNELVFLPGDMCMRWWDRWAINTNRIVPDVLQVNRPKGATVPKKSDEAYLFQKNVIFFEQHGWEFQMGFHPKMTYWVNEGATIPEYAPYRLKPKDPFE